jgi:hypothetical protein
VVARNGQTATPRQPTAWLRPGQLPRQPSADSLRVPRRRPNRLAIAGALAGLLLSGVLAAKLAARADHSVAVLVLAHPVAAGQRLTQGDVAVAHISGSGVHAISAAQRSAVVGDTITSTLPAGTLLTGPMVSTRLVPGPGQAVVGVSLKPGAFAPELAAGATVQVLRVLGATAATAAPSSGQLLTAAAHVLGLDFNASSGTTIVSLLVDQPSAAMIASAAAAGQVALVTVASAS